MEPFMKKFGEKGLKYCTEGNLRRVLTARGMDIEKAMEQLLKTLEWRCMAEPESIVCPACKADPHSHNMRQIGVDASDRPVLYACFSQGINRFDIEMTEHHVIQVLETALASHPAGGDGSEVEQWIWIIDFHGFSFRDCDPRSATMAIDLLQHYPERLSRVVFLDAPYIFGAVWSAIRRVLDERTAGKVVLAVLRSPPPCLPDPASTSAGPCDNYPPDRLPARTPPLRRERPRARRRARTRPGLRARRTAIPRRTDSRDPPLPKGRDGSDGGRGRARRRAVTDTGGPRRRRRAGGVCVVRGHAGRVPAHVPARARRLARQRGRRQQVRRRRRDRRRDRRRRRAAAAAAVTGVTDRARP